MRKHLGWKVTAAITAVVVLGTGCSEAEPEGSPSDAPADSTALDGSIEPTEGDGETVLSMFQGAEWFNGEVPEPSAAGSEEPIRIGFMNVDSAPVGAMPELHNATDGAEAFINAELGGVGGRPVEIVPCILGDALSPEEAAGCARKLVSEDVTAVLGGIGLANGTALSIFEQNGIPYIGGIPVNEDELTSPVSYQFSGGSPAAFAAFAGQAVQEDGAKKVAFVYADYPSIRFAAEEYGMAIAEDLGAEVEGIAYPMVSQDYSGPIQKAVEGDPDVIVAAAADLACQPVMQALVDLSTDATVYMVGSCASPDVVDEVGADKLAGFRFNIENRLDQTASALADTEIYTEVMKRYVPDTQAQSAATVAFKAAMNLWAILDDIGADVTSEDILDAFAATVGQPNFDGHPYTCDGQQIPAYPSICSPQQVLAELKGEGQFVEASDGWVDVPAIVASTIG